MNRRCLFSLCLAVFCLGDGLAQDADPTGPKRQVHRPMPTRTVVICFHRNILEQVFRRSYKRQLPVDRCILDARVVGSASIKCQTELDFDRATDSRISIRLSGDITSLSKGYTNPIVTQTASRIQFSSDLLIGVGDNFSVLPGTVRTRSSSTVCEVSSQRLLGRRIVKHFGPRFARRVLPKYDKAAQRIAEKEILEAAEKEMRTILASINQLFDFDDELAPLISIDDYKPKISKTDTHLQVRFGPEKQLEFKRPKDKIREDVPVEIWIYPKAKRSILEDTVRRLTTVPKGLVEILPQVPDGVKTITDNVQTKPQDDWDVIQIGRFGKGTSRSRTGDSD